MMKQKGGHGLQARITIDDIPQAQLDLLNSSTVTYEIRDAATGALESTVTRPMRSFTANFLRLLWGRMTGTACTGGLDINDTAIDESSGKATNLKCVGAATGLKKFGICIGTGTGAVSQSDNKLTWDTGFSTYGATTTKTATTISGSDIYFEIQKAFTNNTGSTRTVYEAGLCTTGEGTEADNNTNVLIARELTNGATGTAVATGKVLTVVFKISSTFTTDGTINLNFMKSIEWAFIGSKGEVWQTIREDGAADGPTKVRLSQAISYGGKLWIIGGVSASGKTNEVWNSDDDGKTWVLVRENGAASGFAACYYHVCLVYDGKMWVVGGYDGSNNLDSVYSSTDGISWTLVRSSGSGNGFGPRRAHGAAVYDGKMWVVGGYTNQMENSVYYSTNGSNWTCARTNGQANGFTERVPFANGVVVFNNKLFIVGGVLSSDDTDEVNYSEDGVSWTKVRSNNDGSGFPNRNNSCTISYGKYMFQVCGSDYDGTYYNDVYRTLDGQTWTQIASDPVMPNMAGMSCAVHNGEAYLLCGQYPPTPTTMNSVYKTTLSILALSTSSYMDEFARIDAASGSVYGITAGTGTGDFVGTDTVLGTPIADGTGAGQLVYGDMTDTGRLSEPTVSGSDNIMRIERDFTNSSGGSITIKEVGLSAKGLDALGLLLMRGKVDKAVADGASVRVAIELETSV